MRGGGKAPPPGRPKAGQRKTSERSEPQSPPSAGRGLGGRATDSLPPGRPKAGQRKTPERSERPLHPSLGTGVGGRLSLRVQYALNKEGLPSWLPNRNDIRRWVRATRPGAAEVTVRIVDADEARSLNAQYRGKDYATNVLSFVYAAPPELAGDLVLCAPVVAREATEQGKPVVAHFAHLIVHGMLHLQGYDHEHAADARVMEQLERDILARLGYPDPY